MNLAAVSSSHAGGVQGGAGGVSHARQLKATNRRAAKAASSSSSFVARATGRPSGASPSPVPSSSGPIPSPSASQHSTVASAVSASTAAAPQAVRTTNGTSSSSPSALLSAAGAAPSPAPVSALNELGWQTDLASRYILGSTLGGGSYGVVYLAIDRQTGEEVAIKAMAKRRPKSTRERTLKKLVREAALQARTQHCAGVVKLLGAYEDADCAYLVMERLRGGDLDQALANGNGKPLSERAAAAVAHECLKVVATCHAAGVMHGDVKPANFMLREAYFAPEGEPSDGGESSYAPSTAVIEALVAGGNRPPPRWLAAVDFGCAQPLGRASLNRRTGTPVYMAPEVFQRDYGREADLWSTGVMLYQLLSGRFPFWRSLDDCRSRSVDEVMRSVLGDPVPLTGGTWSDKSSACVDLLAGLLDRDPGSRLTAADALEHPWFREQLGGAGATTSTTTTAHGDVVATSVSSTSTSSSRDNESNVVPMTAGGHRGPPSSASSQQRREPTAMRHTPTFSPAVAPACAWYAPGPSSAGMAVA